MAHVVFVSVYDRNAHGLRLMSANLKEHGHRCSMIFLKRYDTNPTYRMDLEVGEYPWIGISKQGRMFKYASNSEISLAELDLLRETIEEIEPDVIGLTVNTPLRIQNVKVTKLLKQNFDVPIIWGGYDPTVNSADCLELCDYACVGEGDTTIVKIADRIDQGRSFDDIGNLAFKRNGTTVENPKNPLENQLDNYPWRDDAPDDKYFIEDDRLERNYGIVNDRASGIYQSMTSRGCPYRCTYCCEATFKDLYSGEVFLRRRSPEDAVAELAVAKKLHNLYKIQFEDEIFAMNFKWLEKFAPLYKEQVGLPFTAYIYPTRNIRNILTLLKDAGLCYCCLALESGSVRVNKQVFDRVYNRELFLDTARICNELGLRFYTDVITYNPYEEEQDLRDTLDVLVEMRGGFDMSINKLFVLPGTKMAERMQKDGREPQDSTRDSLFNYYARLFWVASFTKHSRVVIDAIEKMPIFRRFPALINPALVEVLLNPSSALSTAAHGWLPRSLVGAIQSRRARSRAVTVSRNAADVIREGQQVVCR